MAEDKNNDKDLSGYLRRFSGYALTGSIEEHAFVFGYGTGANGKGVFTGTVQGVPRRLRQHCADRDADGDAKRAPPD